jgi:hypothetical protein
MKKYLKYIGLFATCVCGVTLAFAAEELIAPTRTLERRVQLPGRLSVVSEPPELEVFLDGSPIGKTPIWFQEVKAGSHSLRIGKEETDLVVDTGEKVTISFFKGAFIDISKKMEAAEEPRPAPEKPREEREVKKPRREEDREDIIRFEHFLNRNFDFF